MSERPSHRLIPSFDGPDVLKAWDIDDPIVAEVRAARDMMSAEVEHDLTRLYALFQAREEVERLAGRVVITPRSREPGRPGAAA